MGTEEDYFTSALRLTASYCTRTSHPSPGHFCHVETQLFGRLFVIFFFIQLAIFCYVLLFVCSHPFCFFVRPSVAVARRAAAAPQGDERLAPKLRRKKVKKNNQKLFKTKEKGKCLAQVCGCCVHVPPPITNVTFQLH